MSLSDICIQRPVFATMLVSALVVLGAFSYKDLGVDLFPKVDLPNIVVTTRSPGSGPEEVETQITKVIEEAVNTVEGIDELRSQSFEGLSQVVVVFKLNRDPSDCAQDVRDRVGRVLAKLPDGVDPPIIEKFDPSAAPVITVVVAAPWAHKELTEFAKKKIKEQIESVAGVGQVNMIGGREREVHVALDANQLRALGVTPADVKSALARQNLELPGGLVEMGPRDMVLRTMGRVEQVEDFRKVIVREVGGTLIRIEDLATVSDAQQELRTMARLNGVNAVALVVQKQSGTNTVQVVEAVRRRLEELRSIVPAQVTLSTVRDQSRFIVASFHAVMEHLVLGAVLASLIVLLFLGNLRSTVIAAVAIPTSVISTFSLMRYAGFTLDQMSLLALALAVGLVIDDAIVVLENIFRHIDEKGSGPMTAAREGTREIALAVMATTFSLVVIFVPVAFMPGIIGRFFKTFGLTMTFAILVSMLISFTLTPMMCSRFLRRPATGKGDGGSGRLDWFHSRVEGVYLGLLARSLRHRLAVVVVGILCVLSTVPLLKLVGKDFIPLDDQSEFLINVKAPEGTSIHETSRILTEIEAKLKALGNVQVTLVTIGETAGAGMNEGQIYVGMTDLEQRQLSQFDLMRSTREFLKEDFPALRPTVSVVPALSGGGFKQFDLNLTFRGPDLAVLRRYAEEIKQTLQGIPGVVDLDTSLNFGKPELRVEPDRSRAASIGVDLLDLASTLRTLVGGDEEQVTKYKDPARNEEYEVRVRLEERFRRDPQTVADLSIKARDGFVKLGAIAKVEEGKGPTEIERYGRQRQVSIFANLQGIGLGDAQALVDEKLMTMQFEPGYSYGYLGRSKVMGEMVGGFLMAMALSTLFVYMILAAQFESFLHPVTILLSLPLCIPFGILSLVLAGERMHLYSILGLFMLFGIVKKNSILQVDYANTLRARGTERHEALMESNKTRLRPILMTTLTLVAGMIPMALGTGPGSGSRRAMAIVVIGGQMLCLLITLLMTPVAYSIFDDIANSRLVRRLLPAKTDRG